MPQISELFVSLGVKGSEKTISAFTNVKAGLSGVVTTSLEAKAAILGAIYALERLMSSSLARGLGLDNLSKYLDIDTKRLQQWQYAARQAGESNEEFSSSLKSVYDKMAQIKLGEGVPKGLDIVAQTVGFDINKAYNDVFYVMGQLQKFAKSNVPVDIQNQILKSFGLSENTIVAMRKGVFNAKNFKDSLVLNDKEVSNLSQAQIMWSNLGNKIGFAFDKFTAKNGKEIITNLDQITTQIIKLANSLDLLLTKMKAFNILKVLLKGFNYILTEAIKPKEKQNKEMIESVKDFNQSLEKTREKTQNWEDNFFNKLSNFLPGSNPFNLNDAQNRLKLFPNENILPSRFRLLNNGNSPNNTNINQNLYFQHEGKEYNETKNSTKEAVVLAYKQLYAQSQAT